MSLINVGKDIWLEMNKAKLNEVSEDAKMLFGMLDMWSKNNYDGTYTAHVMLADLIKAFELRGKEMSRCDIGKLANELHKVELLIFNVWPDGSGHEFILGKRSDDMVRANEASEIVKKHNVETAKVTDIGKSYLEFAKETIKKSLEIPNDIPTRLETLKTDTLGK